MKCAWHSSGKPCWTVNREVEVQIHYTLTVHGKIRLRGRGLDRCMPRLKQNDIAQTSYLYGCPRTISRVWIALLHFSSEVVSLPMLGSAIGLHFCVFILGSWQHGECMESGQLWDSSLQINWDIHHQGVWWHISATRRQHCHDAEHVVQSLQETFWGQNQCLGKQAPDHSGMLSKASLSSAISFF